MSDEHDWNCQPDSGGMREIQRKTANGLKRWVASNLHGLGPSGPNPRDIIVVLESDHLSAFQQLEEQIRTLKETLGDFIEEWDDLAMNQLATCYVKARAALKGSE